MTPAVIIHQAKTDGVELGISPAGTIKATGPGEAVKKWLPVIRDHKTAIIEILAQSAANDPAGDDPETRGRPLLAEDATTRQRQRFEAYLNHIMGPAQTDRCCWAPRNHYCPQGQVLWDDYCAHASPLGHCSSAPRGTTEP